MLSKHYLLPSKEKKMEAKRRIHKFNFDQPFMQSGAKTHVALVDKAANLTEALVMKAKHTTVETETEIREYDTDTGVETFSKDSTEVRDYGEDTVYITDRQVRVTNYQVKVR